MSAALLSLGERAAQGLGRGELSQVYIEGESGTVFLVSAEDEAVLVAVAAPGAKVGLMLFEVRRAAAKVADVLRTDRADHDVHDAQDVHDEHRAHDAASDVEEHADTVDVPQQSAPELAESLAPSEAGADANTNGWSSYAPGGTVLPGESGGWS
jgi:hypothetical protein